MFAKHRLTLVWLGLVAATGLSWIFGHGGIANPQVATAVVLGIAFLKVRFVVLDFMEVRTAPLLLRIAAEAWMVLIWLGLVGISIFGASA